MFSRLFDSGIYVSCSNICVTLSNIPYLPFKFHEASSPVLHHLQFIGVVFLAGVPDSGAVF